jgi:hypothetical protein
MDIPIFRNTMPQSTVSQTDIRQRKHDKERISTRSADEKLPIDNQWENEVSKKSFE